MQEKHTPVVLFGSTKGGTGKSMLCANTAVALAMQGHDVLVLDADPQRTMVKFCQRRSAMQKAKAVQGTAEGAATVDGVAPALEADAGTAEGAGTSEKKVMPVVHCLQASADIYDAVMDARRRYDVVLVDSPGADSPELRSGLLAADVFVTPTQASISDLETLPDLTALVRISKRYNPKLHSCVMISRAPTHYKITEAQDARDFLVDLPEFQLLSSTAFDRKAYRDCMLEGMGVVECSAPPSAAALEVHALLEELRSLMWRS